MFQHLFCIIIAKKLRMKTHLLPIILLTLIVSCQSAPEGEKANTELKKEIAVVADAQIYQTDNNSSKVKFIGTKPVGKHFGEFKLNSGNIHIKDENIAAGSFVIEMNSMKITDEGIDESSYNKLRGRLMSDAFFDVEKYKTAKFEITSCAPIHGDTQGTHQISGNLTLKDSTQNISFPAKISITENEISANADFIIDRTKWGLFYGNDKSLGDSYIYPEVKIGLEIQAKK